ncbi:hypothetical protein UVI_02038420 [Ustilaginoidea virens]|uniref:Tyrosine-protein phosphatase non-receptor type 6 n=1 Tax=Ustilaginoidea virens TaxID=1159556 RepID=A0A1B5KVN0_USTVR|nr:hypothetical protein UVI_02038420 [Ustilaginoidea virens]
MDTQSAARAFPNRGRSSQRYKVVQALLIHWGCDDLFVLPELEDLGKCLSEDYAFGTDIFAIPSENAHLELMMRVGQLIKEYESPDTLFLIYYGGHARIDESRQSTWCAWSAIQTLLERSKSDVLILLDCCAGAASATFPNGDSITETISASSWDAIAPDPGRYSFTNALIEVLQEWRMRTFSAAMLHAEVLARLKHPRPVTINGKHFEARSTPVHFMMTANHRAPSIELSRLLLPAKLSETGTEPHPAAPQSTGRAADGGVPVPGGLAAPLEPSEDTPHVMISLALEGDQQLDINAWEQWLQEFPAMAKYVKVQGIFKSHSTLMLVSLPVMVWDLLPEDPAVSFVAFIRSSNLAMQKREASQQVSVPVPTRQRSRLDDSGNRSVMTGASETAFAAMENLPLQQQPRAPPSYGSSSFGENHVLVSSPTARFPQSASTGRPASPSSSVPGSFSRAVRPVVASATSLTPAQQLATGPALSNTPTRQMILNQQQAMRRTTFTGNAPEPRKFSSHVERRLEEYYRQDPWPNDAHRASIASNLGIELWHLEIWFHHRREKDSITSNLASIRVRDVAALETNTNGPRTILPADLNRLLELSRPGDALLFDLRSAAEYERSHIYGAIHLRAPTSFLQPASILMVEQAIPDEQGRRQLSRWTTARCIVFYGRGLDYAWECPAAHVIHQKLTASGWMGHCFVLRGHYREFSQSFGTYIVGPRMTQRARDWVSCQKTTPTTRRDDDEMMERQYLSWLDHVASEERARPFSNAPPALMAERSESLETREKDLEAEFKARCGPLFDKVLGNQPKKTGQDVFDDKAGMVEYLDRGLDKIRELAYQAPTFAQGDSKTLPNEEEGYLGKRPRDQDFEAEYVEVTKTDGSTPVNSPVGQTFPAGKLSGEGQGGRGGGGLLNKMFRR